MKGVFELRTPQDMLKKLRHEYQLLKEEPSDSYLAFNFFVTGYHILDWLYPNDNDKHKEMWEGSPVLLVCAHIANGAKHFEATRLEKKPERRAVSSTELGGSLYFPKGYYSKGYYPRGYFPETYLLIHLEGTAASELGASISAIELAEKVLSYWENNPDIKV